MKKITFISIILLVSFVLPAFSPVSDAEPYYYARLYPVSPLVLDTLDNLAIRDIKYLGNSVVARLTLEQMTKLYKSITLLQKEHEALVTFESVPLQSYELSIQPWEVGNNAIAKENFQTKKQGSQSVAIIVEQSIYKGVQKAIRTYIKDVKSLHPDVKLFVFQSSAATPEDMRSFLNNLHQKRKIKGAILIGLLPYARWEFPWGEEVSLPLFYENLDDIFIDQDQDGLYDYHDWGTNEGVEIWVSWIRPPLQDSVVALQEYFYKTHNYYSGNNQKAQRALLSISHDWWSAGDFMRKPLTELYGDNVDQLGGCENCYLRLSEYLDYYTNNDYGVQNLWVHSSNTAHYFDYFPGEPSWISSATLAQQPRGPQFTILWACNVMNFIGNPDEIFASRYLMGTNNGLAALGVTRSYGTPEQDHLISLLPQTPFLGDAVFRYLNRVTSKEFPTFANPDEIYTFVFDIALVGDPFLVFP